MLLTDDRAQEMQMWLDHLVSGETTRMEVIKISLLQVMTRNLICWLLPCHYLTVAVEAIKSTSVTHFYTDFVGFKHPQEKNISSIYFVSIKNTL